MEGFGVGRIVHYVLPHGPNEGEHRPAVVVRVWNKETGCGNLLVFLDGSNDGVAQTSTMYWAPSVAYNANKHLGTWHWPERE